MNVLLWILQILLALVFLAVGGIKLARPKAALLDRMGALAPFRPVTIKAIGLAEVLGGVGVVLPMLVGVAEGVVPWAALGLACVMVGAAFTHANQGDYKPLAMHAVLLAMAVAVMVGRSAHLPL